WDAAAKNTKGQYQSGNLAQGSYTYTLTCTAPDGSQSTKAIVVVAGNPGVSSTPPTLTFSASPSIVKNGSTTLTWNATSAQCCTAAGGDTADGDGWDVKPIGTSGTFTANHLTTKGTSSYKLTCTSADGATTSFV